MGCCKSKPKEKKEPTPKEKSVQKEPTPKASSHKSASVVREAEEEEVNKELQEDVQAPQDEETVNEEVVEKDLKGDRLAVINTERAKDGINDFCATAEVDGFSTALFPEGLVYRIVKDDAWYIYNDTQIYEAHIDYRFGPDSDLTAGDRTTLEETADGWFRATCVVYPLETCVFIKGKIDGYKSGVTVVPLSSEFRQREAELATAVCNEEIQAVRDLADDAADEENVLEKCLESNTPFVDLGFLPTEMLSRPNIDRRQFPPIAVQRPTQYLPESERDGLDSIRGPVLPQSVHQGELGDSWLASAVAILAEDEELVKNVFSKGTLEEKNLGAFRVMVSKQGWWRSIIVDNYLPTVANRPLFAHMVDDPRELWVSLLQKAYAKVHGSYASITGGDALQALQDITGAPTYRFDKEWEEAVNDPYKVEEFHEKLLKYKQLGYKLVLNTPGHESKSYLGTRYGEDYEEFKCTYANKGLRLGFTYYVDEVEGKGDNLYFKVRNPWVSVDHMAEDWLDEDADETIQMACKDSAKMSYAWIRWKDAINYFDGGGVLYTMKNPTDFRVRGCFEDVCPNTVLEVRVSEPVETMLILSQPDKRGVAPGEQTTRYAPIMLSVSRSDGTDKQRVDKNSGWDPENPSSEYNFVVARDVALKYTFTPESSPYYIIPRIHRKGVSQDYDRPYTIGMLSDQSANEKLNVVVKQLDEGNRVLKNLVTFSTASISDNKAEIQYHRESDAPSCLINSVVCGPAAEQNAENDDQDEQNSNSADNLNEVSGAQSSEAPSQDARETSALEESHVEENQISISETRGAEAAKTPATPPVAISDEEPTEAAEPKVDSAQEEQEPAKHDSDSDSGESGVKPASEKSKEEEKTQTEDEGKAEEAPEEEKEPSVEEEQKKSPSEDAEKPTEHPSRFENLKIKDSDEDSDMREL